MEWGNCKISLIWERLESDDEREKGNHCCSSIRFYGR